MNYSFNEYMEFLTEAATKESSIGVSEEDTKLFKGAGFKYVPSKNRFEYLVGKKTNVGLYKVVGYSKKESYSLYFVLTDYNSTEEFAEFSADTYKTLSKETLDKYVETCIDVFSTIESLKDIK